MPEKKRPILTVFIILGITVIFLGAVMAIIITLFGPSSNISLSHKIGVIPIEGPIMDSQPILSQLVNTRKTGE